jgi:Helix-turn-helix domain
MTHDKPDSFGAYGATSWPDAKADPPRLDAAPVPPPPRPEVYSLRDVAEIFGRTERTIRSWVKAGHLQRGGFGNALFFSRAAIEALLNGRRQG